MQLFFFDLWKKCDICPSKYPARKLEIFFSFFSDCNGAADLRSQEDFKSFFVFQHWNRRKKTSIGPVIRIFTLGVVLDEIIYENNLGTSYDIEILVRDVSAPYVLSLHGINIRTGAISFSQNQRPFITNSKIVKESRKYWESKVFH